MRTWNTRDTVHISYNSVANHGRILNNLRVEEKHIYACFSFTLNPCLAELEVFHIAFWTKYSLLDSCPQYCCQQLDGSHMMTNINDKKKTRVTSSKGYGGVDTRLQTITKHLVPSITACWVGTLMFGHEKDPNEPVEVSEVQQSTRHPNDILRWDISTRNVLIIAAGVNIHW